MLATAGELRAEITEVRAELDSNVVQHDQAVDIDERAVARLGLQVGGRWLEELEELEELESQLPLVDD